MVQLIHPELSYAVRGVLLHVYNSLGPMLKEEFYEQAIAIGLEKRGIAVETEKAFEVYYAGERVGLYRVDVWIRNGFIRNWPKPSCALVIRCISRSAPACCIKSTDAPP